MIMSQFDKATMDAGCNNMRLMMWMSVDVECKDWLRTIPVEVICNNGKYDIPLNEAATRIVPSSRNAGSVLSEAVATLIVDSRESERLDDG
jgi:hypothetical protein